MTIKRAMLLVIGQDSIYPVDMTIKRAMLLVIGQDSSCPTNDGSSCCQKMVKIC